MIQNKLECLSPSDKEKSFIFGLSTTSCFNATKLDYMNEADLKVFLVHHDIHQNNIQHNDMLSSTLSNVVLIVNMLSVKQTFLLLSTVN